MDCQVQKPRRSARCVAPAMPCALNSVAVATRDPEASPRDRQASHREPKLWAGSQARAGG
jgi:hypothetical protein